MTTSNTKTQINILALHGYIQNTYLMRKTMEKLFNGKQCSQINWIVPEGPFEVDSSELERKRGWWKLPSKDMFCKPHEYENVETAIQTVKDTLQGVQPDVVIGFSQSGVLATILLSRNMLSSCKLAILMSGSDIQDERFVPDAGIVTPTIMMIGTKDTLCTPDHTRQLAKRFKTVEFMEHKWGHVIPSSASIRDTLLKAMNVI